MEMPSDMDDAQNAAASSSWRGFPLPFMNRKKTLILHAPSRLSHPTFYHFPPPCVMSGLLVGLGCRFVAVGFIQDEPLGIIGVLEHVKTQIAQLQDRTGSVLAGGRDELFNMLRLNLHVNTYHEHRQSLS